MAVTVMYEVGSDIQHDWALTLDQAGIFCVLMVRAAALLSADSAEREHVQRNAHN